MRECDAMRILANCFDQQIFTDKESICNCIWQYKREEQCLQTREQGKVIIVGPVYYCSIIPILSRHLRPLSLSVSFSVCQNSFA